MMNFSRNYPRVFVRNFADIKPFKTFQWNPINGRQMNPLQYIMEAAGVDNPETLRENISPAMFYDPKQRKTLMRLAESQPDSKLAEVARAVQHYENDIVPMTPEQEFDMRNAGARVQASPISSETTGKLNDQIENLLRSRANAAVMAARAKK